MERELIINASNKGLEMALLEDKVLVELHKSNKNSLFNVGDVFLGKVKKVMPGLNAAFVDVGYHKDAFLHYSDLGANYKTFEKYVEKGISGAQKTHKLGYFRIEKEIVKGGKISDVISKGDLVMTQILKEPISTKGPRLTSEVTLAGRYLVLVPFSTTIGISKKIMLPEERKRLKNLMEGILPKNFGVVVRTSAEGKSVAELHEDMNQVFVKWERILENLQNAKYRKQLLGDNSKTSVLLTDVVNDSYTRVVANNNSVVEEIKTAIAKMAPEKASIVSKHGANRPIFDHYGITRQVKSSFGKNVTMKSGAYLVIEHTEALHVVDVNSGHKVSAEGSQEDTALMVNLESASEMARQLRLRDIGGIIVIDFIDMKNPDNRKKLQDHMKQVMKNDKAKHTILPISKFGLMQITRQRVRPQVNISTNEVCPSCNGTGEVESSLLLLETIENELNYLLNEQNQKEIKLVVHPFLESHIKKGFFSSIQKKWKARFKKKITVYSNEDYSFIEYHFYDKEGEEIEIQYMVEED